jgi:hypothetical protein
MTDKLWKEIDTDVCHACWAHTNLAMFEAIVALIEGGIHFGTSAAEAAEQIRKICLKAQTKQLGDLNKAKIAILQKMDSAARGNP